MTSIFGTLNIGRVAVGVQQAAIDVTGHNISNVNTEGYTRQRVNMTSTSVAGYQNMNMGTGVAIDDIERIYDKFIQRQIGTENQEMGYWEGKTSYLEQVEIVFNETSGSGISQALDNYWNAWNDVANNPTGYVERISLINAGSTLAMSFNQSRETLSDLQNYISSDIEANLEDINLKASQIRDLNKQILQSETAGSEANDLRDQRDLLVNELSKLIDVNVSEDNNGNVNIYIGSGQSLVTGVDSWQLSTATDPSSPNQDRIVWNAKDGSTVDITSDIDNGTIKGMLEVRDTVVPEYISKLDNLASNIISEVNDLHSWGNDPTGQNFFSGTDAGDMAVAISDPDEVVTRAIAAGEGDNSVALAIAELQNENTIMGTNTTFSDYYQSLVSDIGNAVQYSQNSLTNQTAMVDQVTTYRESLSGVSLDEEMVNLVKYQHAYDAAAKLISTVDEMLDTLLSLA